VNAVKFVVERKPKTHPLETKGGAPGRKPKSEKRNWEMRNKRVA